MGKLKTRYTTLDMYKYFQECNPEADVCKDLYIKIVEESWEMIRYSVIDEARIFTLPSKLGSINIRKYKPKKIGSSKSMSIDFKTSKELGKIVYHLNDHSDGYKFRLFWAKQGCSIRNFYGYQMMLIRDAKRYLASLIKNNKNDYLEN